MDILTIASFNARYAEAIDSDGLENWPRFFTADCQYTITTLDNRRENLQAGIMYADSRSMLEDRVSALRNANIYERQTYRHMLGLPIASGARGEQGAFKTAFMVTRIMHSGEVTIFATGVYEDRFVQHGEDLLLASRLVICDSHATDTLIALPL